MIDTDTDASLRFRYRTLILNWDEARDNPPEANQYFDAIQKLQKVMRESEDGRLAIIGLLNDPVIAVQLIAASHSLTFEPDRAIEVLTKLEQGGGLHAVAAKWTLRSYRDGTLDLDW